MIQLSTTQSKVARDCGQSSTPPLSQWLNGNQTHTPSVICAGAKAMQWYEANKSRPTAPPKQPPPPYKPADAKRARPHTNLFALDFRIVAKISAVCISLQLLTDPRIHY